MLRRLVAIVGPTASGKSRMALALAERLGGEIVNADSRQVYRGMDIGTAKPSWEERRRVRHHLYDIVEASESYSLALYCRQARAALEDCWSRGTFPWLVGGTGQYVWGLLEDWHVPEVAPNEALRSQLAAVAEGEGAESLHHRLERVDPLAAGRIDPRNVRRVVRALEVYEHTGVPISTWQTKGKPDFEVLLFGIDVPRDELDRRIEQRVAEMFASGFVEEVRNLLDGGLATDAPAMSSIGYSEVVRYLKGEITDQKAQELTQRATRRLARRQGQWFRRDDNRIAWVRDADGVEMQANIFTGACTNTVLRGGR